MGVPKGGGRGPLGLRVEKRKEVIDWQTALSLLSARSVHHRLKTVRRMNSKERGVFQRILKRIIFLGAYFN